MIEIEEIQKLHKKYVGYCNKFLNICNRQPFINLMDELGERAILCPSSQRDDLHLAHPGGLIRHSLNVLNIFTSVFMKEASSDELEALTTVSLLHDIGKIGDKKNEYYLTANSQRYNYYINEKLKDMTVPQRSIKLLTDYGFKLTDEQYIAILNSYLFIERIDQWQSVFSLPDLAINLAIAKLLAIKMEKVNKK